ncbi:MAG: hypothetical protein J6K48_04760 [Lachnospiraceae bacterium]|nr:hypothetical protein [Lachnospiraceae bacterium]
MDDAGTKKKEFVGYEYKEVITDQSRVAFLLDGYENFGWESDGNICEDFREKTNPQKQRKVILRLKRNRKIINKMELTRLQRNFEACVSEIEALEKSKNSAATVYALILGILGTAFMAGSTFAVTAQPPHVILCILLAIPGFMGWILPYFVYKRVLGKQTERVMPLIEEKYDEIYLICEKGNKLLYWQ